MYSVSQPIILKVYGNLAPATTSMVDAVNILCRECYPAPEDAVCRLAGDLLTISFEGIYFPTAEVLAALSEDLQASKGKLDELDLENWRLTRYLFQDGMVKSSAVPLNHVLAWSGH